MKAPAKKISNPTKKKVTRSRKLKRPQWRIDKENRGDYTNQKEIGREEKLRMLKEFKEYQIANRLNFDEDNLTLRRYWMLKGFRLCRISQWIAEDPELNPEDYLFGKEMMGDKRQVGWEKGYLPEKSVLRTLHNYIEDEKLVDKYHQELRKDETPPPTQVNLTMKDYK